MAAMWWWAPLPAWLSSSALWFLVVNVVVAAVAVLSRARPPLPSPRRGSSGVTRRASSAVLQSLRSFSIFSFPSASFNTTTPFPHPDSPTAAVAAAQAQETEELVTTPKTTKPLPHPDSPTATATASTAATQETETEEPPTPRTLKTARPLPRALPLPPSPLSSSSSVRAPAADADDEDRDESTGMSMDEAYALALEARQRPEQETEEEARRSEVDAKAEEFIRGFKEDRRQERLNSIFNYTQMLKQRAHGGGGAADRRQPDQL